MKKRKISFISHCSRLLFKKMPIEVVYLYGSVARGQEDALSDYDFGILFSQKIPSDQRFDLRLKLFGLLAQNLGVDENKVDVVDLQNASALLQFNAISGKVIYVKSQERRVEFEPYVMAKYHDEHYYLDQYLSQTIAKIEKGDYFERRLSYS